MAELVNYARGVLHLGVLRLAQPGGMSYGSALSTTAEGMQPLVLGEHGRSGVFCVNTRHI